MSHLVLARKWRPQVFEEVVGQRHITKTLQNALRYNRVAHAFLLTGPRGIGKTSVARILAKALNCELGPTERPCNKCQFCEEITVGGSLDVLEIDGASNTGVDNIRELREGIKYLPSYSRHKIYIIDEAHMLSTSAFNALLKTLEEPPGHAIFILATTEPHKLPATILSRCQRFDFKQISLLEIMEKLRFIALQEGIKLTERPLYLIAREASGSMRDALSILEQAISFSDDEISEEKVEEILGIMNRGLWHEIFSALLERDTKKCLEIVERVYNSGYDIRQFHKGLVEHTRNLLVTKIGKDHHLFPGLSLDEFRELEAKTQKVDGERIQQWLRILIEGEGELERGSFPRIALEMILIRMAYSESMTPLFDILDRIEDLEKRLAKSTEIFSEETDLGKNWTKLIGFVRKRRPLLASFLEQGQLIHLDQRRIEIGFAPDSIFWQSLKEDENEKFLRKVCQEFFGSQIELNISVNRGSEAASSEENLNLSLEERLREESLQNPIIQEALRIFKGGISEVKLLKRR